MKKKLKFFLVFLLGFSLVITAIIGYEKFKNIIIKDAALEFETTLEWKWHDKNNFIQIHYDDLKNRSILRKVYLDKKYSVYAKKNDDYTLSAAVFFHERCVPGEKILTSKNYSNGKPIELTCAEDGSSLIHSAVWKNKNSKFIWEGDLDGYKFREDFSTWDFTKLDQEIYSKFGLKAE